jgi:lincosamide nucleotidyltransferase A/C/D/E
MCAEQQSGPLMTAVEVLALMKLFDELGIEVVADGGWAVDALLGTQTRQHADLDLAIPHKYAPEMRKLLARRGYYELPRPDTRDCNFVMGDDQGHQVDIHTYTYDEQGNLTFGLPYPLDSLDGHGAILDYPVRCITPEWLVRFHSGYELDETDYHDVRALCMRFDIELPIEYTKFTGYE